MTSVHSIGLLLDLTRDMDLSKPAKTIKTIKPIRKPATPFKPTRRRDWSMLPNNHLILYLSYHK